MENAPVLYINALHPEHSPKPVHLDDQIPTPLLYEERGGHINPLGPEVKMLQGDELLIIGTVIGTEYLPTHSVAYPEGDTPQVDGKPLAEIPQGRFPDHGLLFSFEPR